MKKIMIHWKRIVLLVVVSFFILQFVGGFFFYNLAIKRGPKEFLQNNADLEVQEDTMKLYTNGDWTKWVNEQNFENLTLTSRDGLELHGYYLPAKKLLIN